MKTEKEIKENIINQIILIYSKISLSNSYKNFGKNKDKTLGDFIQKIIDNKEKIYKLSDNEFYKNIEKEIEEKLLKIQENNQKSKVLPNFLNLAINLNESFKFDINSNQKKIQENNIEIDIKIMLEKYFNKEYDLKSVDKFIKTLSKSVSITNEKYLLTHSLITKQIVKINSPYTMDKDIEIQQLATDLENHLNPKDKLPPSELDNNPTGPDLN